MPRKEPNRTTDAAILIRFKEEQRYRIETATAILVARTGVKSAKIGAAWTNKDGSISVVLDPFVTVTSSPSVLLTLFPWDEKPLSPVTKAGK